MVKSFPRTGKRFRNQTKFLKSLSKFFRTKTPWFYKKEYNCLSKAKVNSYLVLNINLNIT